MYLPTCATPLHGPYVHLGQFLCLAVIMDRAVIRTELSNITTYWSVVIVTELQVVAL